MKYLLAITLASTAAFAQQPTSLERAISSKMMAEINSGLQCSVGLIDAQSALAAAQARIKELEAKLEEK